MLTLHAGALGDCVLALHVAAAVRRALPNARIEMAARSPVARFAVEHGPIDEAWSPELFGLHHLYGDGALPVEVSERLDRYDLVVNFLAGPNARVSKRLKASVSCPVLSVDPVPRPVMPPRHITTQWLDALGRAGLALERDPGTLFNVAPQDRAAARDRIAELVGRAPGRTVICHPGAGGRAKCCPTEALEQMARRLRHDGVTFLWMIGPTEMEWHGPGYVDGLSRTAPVVFEECIPAAAVLLSGADAFVGHDAGMTHLAAGLGLPTVALFGPTDPEVWGPLGPVVTILRFNAGIKEDRLVARIVAGVTG